MKKIAKRISAFALAFTLIGGVSTAVKSVSPSFDTAITANAAGYSTSYTYCTPASDLQIRQGAGTSYGLVKVSGKTTYVKTGSNFNIISVNGEWGYSTSIPTNQGKNVSGWVKLSFCNYFSRNSKLKICKVTTKTDPLTKRTGPSTKYGNVGSVAKGNYVTVYAECAGFSAIDSSLETWVSTSYLTTIQYV